MRLCPQYRYWGDHVKKGHAGTAIFSKIKPLNVSKGFQASEEVTAADSEGRMITLEFENSYVVGTCASSHSLFLLRLGKLLLASLPLSLSRFLDVCTLLIVSPPRRPERRKWSEDAAGEGEVEQGVRDLPARARREEARHLVR